MQIEALPIADVKLVRTRLHVDERGFLTEIYNFREFARAGLGIRFVQDNLSRSLHVGTVRGLHFQRSAAAQSKLVRVMRGRILDVAVDIRSGSPTFGRHVAVELSAEDGAQLFVPAGFAHGFCTLEPMTEILYKLDGFHEPAQEVGIRWNDPALAIAWPVAEDAAILSPRDRQLPPLAALQPWP